MTCLSWYIYMQYLTDDAPVLPNGIPMMFVSLVALVTVVAVVSLVAVASVESLLELLYTKGRVSGRYLTFPKWSLEYVLDYLMHTHSSC